jgi:predicted acylesterase/phospholipase RssA
VNITMPPTCGAKTAFVLAGGGSLGAVQMGMLKAFEAVRPDELLPHQHEHNGV